MNSVRCFLLEPTELAQVSLRRYRGSDEGGACSAPPSPHFPGAMPQAWGYHDASVAIEHVPVDVHALEVSDDYKLDPRWPTRCRCGYAFEPGDHWQRNVLSLYVRRDTGEMFTISGAPAGAIWDAHWFARIAGYQRGPDGRCLVVKTPAGDWVIDGPASNGPGWTRRGEPPDLVVQPSIGIGEPQRFHGWLGGSDGSQPGWLVIDKP